MPMFVELTFGTKSIWLSVSLQGSISGFGGLTDTVLKTSYSPLRTSQTISKTYLVSYVKLKEDEPKTEAHRGQDKRSYIVHEFRT